MPPPDLWSQHSPRDQRPPWVQELKTLCMEHSLPPLSFARPMVVETAFTGLGSSAALLQLLGFPFLHVASADPKASATEFLEKNGLWGEHHFEDVADLQTGEARKCTRHSRSCLPAGGASPDMVVLGFPCKPWSTMRLGRHTTAPPCQHHDYYATAAAVQYVQRSQAKLAVFENTLGLADLATSSACGSNAADGSNGADGSNAAAEASGLEMLLDGLRQDYWAEAVVLDLHPWVNFNRRRWWVLCVHRSLSSSNLALEAVALCRLLESARGRTPPVTWQSQLHAEDSYLWRQEILLPVRQTKKCTKENAKWQSEAQGVRAQLREASFKSWAATPWTDRQLRGVPKTDRVAELLQLGALVACVAHGKEEATPEAVEEATAGWTCDFSQSPARKPWRHGSLPSLCTSTELYSYSHDRAITAQELFRMMGWQVPVSLGSLPGHKVRDLLGEAMALQPHAVAAVGLLHVAGASVPGLLRAAV